MAELKSNTKQSDTTTKILIALVAVMVVAIGIMGYMLYDLSRRNDKIIVQNQDISLEKDNLKTELNSLYDDYSSLETSNDSLNAEIEKEKEHIKTLIKELEDVKSYSYSVKKKYEKELASLRNIMRHYVYQIDSLDQLNKHLIAENIQIKDDNDRIKDEMDQVVEMNDELESTIEIASIIKTSNIQTAFLNKRGKDTRKSSRIKKFKVSFNLVANDLAESGSRRVYLRILRPDGFCMTNGSTLTYREKKIPYSAHRDVIYNNKELPVVIFYDVTQKLTLGKYIVEIYMDNEIVGKSFFNIEK